MTILSEQKTRPTVYGVNVKIFFCLISFSDRNFWLLVFDMEVGIWDPLFITSQGGWFSKNVVFHN